MKILKRCAVAVAVAASLVAFSVVQLPAGAETSEPLSAEKLMAMTPEKQGDSASSPDGGRSCY
jgi:hypothetical protein